MVARLAAVNMLHRHSAAAAVALLQRLARDPEPAVAAVAVGSPAVENAPTHAHKVDFKVGAARTQFDSCLGCEP